MITRTALFLSLLLCSFALGKPALADATILEEAEEETPATEPLKAGESDGSIESDHPPTPPTSADQTSQNAPTEEIDDQPSHRWAVGTNLAWTTRQDYGSRNYRRLTPEIVGYVYGATPYENWWWRLGTRLGYSADQPEMPQAVRIEETDTLWLFEAALTLDWYVVPSFSVGGGYDFRKTRVKTAPPIDTVDDRFNRTDRLPLWYVQLGAGLPMLQGRYMIEPLVRYHNIQYDNRSHWLFGFEATVGF